MAVYEIFFKRSVTKDLERIPPKDLKRVIRLIESLGENPRPHGSEKLTGQDRYRIREGYYRIVYSIQNKDLTIWVVKVGHRRDIYKRLIKE